MEFVYLMKELKLESGPRFSIVVAGAVLLPSLTLRDIIGKCGSCGCKCGSCGCNCGHGKLKDLEIEGKILDVDHFLKPLVEHFFFFNISLACLYVL